MEQVRTGQVGIDEAMDKLRHLPYENLGFAHVDHHRQMRRGFPEVIYCPGKTTEQIVEIFARLVQKGGNILATRAGRDIYDALTAAGEYDKLRYEEAARIIVLEQKKLDEPKGLIAIVTAGTADLPVAMEAKVTADMMGQRTELLCDVGVAGLHRLLGSMEVLHKANVVVVVADD